MRQPLLVQNPGQLGRGGRVSRRGTCPRFIHITLQATYIADRATRQAANALGVPQGTVKSRVYYALRSLSTALEERGTR
ncbi:hypothetical protein [Streptosporangium sp. NPDC003464]